MKWSFLITILILISSVVQANILRVPVVYPTIQQAILSATDGDTISICSDTRYQPEYLSVDNKTIFIYNCELPWGFSKTEIISTTTDPFLNRTYRTYWEGQRLVNQLDSESDYTGRRCLSFDQFDIPWVVWWGKDIQNREQQIYYTSWDETNWGEEKLVYHVPDTFCNYQPSITFDNESRAWVAWTREDGYQGHGDYEIYFTKWNGNDWEPRQQINATNLQRRDFAECISCGINEIWIIATGLYFTNPLTPDSCAIFASRWNGTSWDTLYQISPADGGWHWFGNVVVDYNGISHVVWCDSRSGRIYYRMHSNSGWTTPVSINDPGFVYCASWAAPKIALDNNGNRHVVWLGVTSGESDWDVFYSKYDGQQWSSPLRLNINDDYRDYYPDIAASNPNNIWAVWDKDASVEDIYFTHYDGYEWSREEILSDQSNVVYNHSADIALNPDGNPWVLWHGKTQTVGNYDIYSNRYLNTQITECEAAQSKLIWSCHNCPNPFSFNTNITYTLTFSAHVELKIYTLAGIKVKSLVDMFQKNGHYSVMWDRTDNKGKRMKSGVYFYKFSVNGLSDTKKVLLIE
jgi:hypothetical protein